MRILALIAFLFLSSCGEKQVESTAYSPEFKKILDKVNDISDRNPEDGVKYLDSAYSAVSFPNVNDRFRFLSFHFLLAGKTRRNFRQALLYADSMLTYINKNGGQQRYPSNFAEANFAKGDAYFELHDYNTAYQFYFNGYQSGKNHLNNYVISGYSYRMGMITYQQSHYNLAIDYFKDSYEQSLPYDKDFVNFFRNQEVLDNIGLAYKKLDKADSALLFFNSAINYINKKKLRFPEKFNLTGVAIAVVKGNLADIYIGQKKYPEAINLLKASIATNITKYGDNSDALLTEVKLARVYALQNESNLLITLLNIIKEQLKTISNKTAEADWYSLMSDYYLNKNEPTLALMFNKKYNILKDSLNESTRLLKETNVTEQLNNYEKEFEIKNLTDYSKLQKIYLLVSAIAGLMALVIIFMIYRNWKRSRRELHTISLLNTQVIEQKTSLEATLEKLNKSSEEKDRILHTVAHDLRNPLGGIASLTNIMASEDGLSAEQSGYVNIIKDTADNSLELINEIFEATEATMAVDNMQPVELNALLKNSIELLKFKAAEKHQQINFIPGGTPGHVIANREKIWRVVSNLIVNAIKFSAIGSSITVSTTCENGNVVIAVKDEGIGIPENLKAKIFHMFTEAKRPGTMGERSFGLGLSICYQIIEKHNGKIWFENNLDKGTTFYVSLSYTPAGLTAGE